MKILQMLKTLVTVRGLKSLLLGKEVDSLGDVTLGVVVDCKNNHINVIARLTKSAEAISEVGMRLPRFARNDG